MTSNERLRVAGLLLLPVVVIATALAAPSIASFGNDESAQTFRGEYNWVDGASGPLTAEFVPDGEDSWKVKFRFEFSGKDNTWKGTARGSLADGSAVTGTSNWRGRRWVFSGQIDDGVLRGEHTELRKDDSEYETGTFELRR